MSEALFTSLRIEALDKKWPCKENSTLSDR
jgi:hypothetical protein